MPWWIAGTTTTSSGTGPYKVQVITSADGIEMTEAEFYNLWKAEKSSNSN